MRGRRFLPANGAMFASRQDAIIRGPCDRATPWFDSRLLLGHLGLSFKKIPIQAEYFATLRVPNVPPNDKDALLRVPVPLDWLFFPQQPRQP